MNNPLFKVGDVVKLKSGSPDMTIVKIMNTLGPEMKSIFKGTYLCTWFVDTLLNDKVEFPENALELNR